MIGAIVYTSNTGYTAQYAQLLGNRTGLPVTELAKSEQVLEEGTEILYLGWLMAGVVKGYKKANARYRVRAVCGVGMGATGTQIAEIRKANGLAQDFPLFTLQGGFQMEKLHGIYRWMMRFMAKTVGAKLEKKENRTADEEQMLDMMKNGASYVSQENLSAVLSWYEASKAL